MTESTTTNPNGDDYHWKQYQTTIPKDLAEFFDTDRETSLEWKVGGASNKLEITVHDNSEDNP